MATTTTDNTILWRDPPKATRRGKPWDAIAAALRERPGEWALVATDVWASTSQNIRTGKIAAFRRAVWETRTVAKPNFDGRSDVYARFIRDL